MDEIQNSNFSDIPALGDDQGLANYIQNETLAAQGLQSSSAETSSSVPATGTTPVATAQPTVQTQQTLPNTDTVHTPIGLTQEQLAQIAETVRQVNASVANNTPVTQPTTPVQNTNVSQGYTDKERNFITQALARGYSLNDINSVIEKNRNGMSNANANQNAALAQQVANIQNYLKTQEYKAAETAFVSKLSSFGDKFGLSEQDLVTFGNAALTKGINIAMPNVDLETVFRAVYPEQYRIRMQRMSPTNASQIYGGTSIPESGNRAAASKLEDAYVDSFLKQAMPNQFQMNKK